MDTDVIRARRLYGRLIDADADPGAGGVVLDVVSDERADEVSRRLAELFAERPGVDAVVLRVNGHPIGASTRARVVAAAGFAGATPEFGMADRAALPGLSGQYRLVRFACARPGCRAREARSFYDERTVPVCAAAGHGVMELLR
ncbi:hypothetical protein [Streptomyces sp. SBT349]|uniref:hypothetical protein n=1 Tax=Streptomyces sp. SBT349 TaxID=1580539 RepID=UPI00131DAD2A|nr:hypothetical protein [Streptomyces sp. SBT349]